MLKCSTTTDCIQSQARRLQVQSLLDLEDGTCSWLNTTVLAE